MSASTRWPTPPSLPFWRPQPIELAGGWIPGVTADWGTSFGSSLSPIPIWDSPAPSLVEALERVIRPALEQQQCAVLFSGGRDSSMILAITVGLARREGHPEPVAITRSFPGIASADEYEWQRLVVDHLGVREWNRIDQTDDGRVLSSTVTSGLRRFGVLYPPMVHALTPVFPHVAGGVVLTGEGGDEWLGPHRATPFAMLRSRSGLSRPDLYQHAFEASLPKSARQRLLRRRFANDCLWLRPAARDEFLTSVIEDETNAPFNWGEALVRLGHRRSVCASTRNVAALASTWGVRVVNPLHTAEFTRALQCAGGRLGFPGRTSLMREMASDLLPPELIRRRSKAYLDEAMWAERGSFAETWSGGGLDQTLVDSSVLRRVWESPEPDSRTVMLLHSAWLHDAGGDDAVPDVRRARSTPP